MDICAAAPEAPAVDLGAQQSHRQHAQDTRHVQVSIMSYLPGRGNTGNAAMRPALVEVATAGLTQASAPNKPPTIKIRFLLNVIFIYLHNLL